MPAPERPAPALFGFIGRSGAGKTTLILDVIAQLRGEGCVVSAIKRAHDGLDLDRPGKDSWRMREAGCREVIIAGDRRFALLHEYRDAPEPDPLDLARRLDSADVVLLEGFRSAPIPTIEVYRPSLGLPMLWPQHPSVIALATDGDADCPLPRLALADAAAVARFVRERLGLRPPAVRGPRAIQVRRRLR
ncbi:MAG: molybdopterin-guanine dinucleotide biosynthesis protein B [Betaproteobacteria bacterium]|nr:molybdopterin-guanine dinucleotide biosynthesis protein B [Betaproteobacteria bacterium]